MNHLNRNHVLAGLFLLALGFFVVQQSLQWEILGVNGPGVGFFPLAYGSLIVVLALVLTLKSMWAQLQQKRQTLELELDHLVQTETPGKVFAALSVWLAFFVVFGLLLKVQLPVGIWTGV